MTSIQENSRIKSAEQITEDIFRLTLHAPMIVSQAKPGQFVMVKTSSNLDPLLRRPFSIHDVSADGDLLLLYKTIGKGTTLLSALTQGMSVDLIGPLGNCFTYSGNHDVCLIGGGMGIAPLLFWARHLSSGVTKPGTHRVLLGARHRRELQPIATAFQSLGYNVDLATDDGSLGHHGFVSQLLPPILPSVQGVYVCGPTPLMQEVANQCHEIDIPCQASMETHMACGLGACLGCTIHGSDGTYKHVCKHGPIFDAKEVLWTI
ncbi:dihydroorotate dehydrogenase electron transfer subunit [Desulfogranum marinum]|uniref:dihydroorotate dehydrogenase electron transfer subunit n=1 Tax=Desulfogranum marinum TaxID=453220 RepID=UPI0029C62D65|nr:dihydroorotate dehydrogenase electron transfer subunit [Desulfogranum marinum]